MIRKGVFHHIGWLSALMLLILASLACNLGQTPPPAATVTQPAVPTSRSSPTAAVNQQPITETPVATATNQPLPPTPSAGLLNEPNFQAIAMLDENNGWGIDLAKLGRTMDGGVTWFDVTPPGVTELGYGVPGFFYTPTHAWLLVPNPTDYERATLFWTQDGGANWENIATPFGSGQMFFLDDLHGFVMVFTGAGAGSSTVDIYRTNNSGFTWELVHRIDPMAGDTTGMLPLSGMKNGVTFLTPSLGWVTGDIPMENYPMLFHSMDGGQTWFYQEIPLPDEPETAFIEVKQPVFFDFQQGIMPARLYQETTQMVFYRTSDSGTSWQPSNPVLVSGPYDFVSPKLGWVWDGVSLARTSDGGETWEVSGTNVNFDQSVIQIDFVDAEHGWALIYDSSGVNQLWRTLNSGLEWTALTGLP